MAMQQQMQRQMQQMYTAAPVSIPTPLPSALQQAMNQQLQQQMAAVYSPTTCSNPARKSKWYEKLSVRANASWKEKGGSKADIHVHYGQ